MLVKVLPLGAIGANCYIVKDEESGEAAVIDCGAFNGELKKALRDDVGRVKYILLTHGHFDHVLGVPELRRLTGARVLIHENDADCLYDERRSLIFRHAPGTQELINADGFLRDGDVLSLGSLEIRVIHTPGHSKGSVCFICGDCIFTGDTLFCKAFGRTDFPDGDMRDLRESIKRLFALPGGYTVYPGHNRSTTLEAERKTNRILRNKDVFGDN